MFIAHALRFNAANAFFLLSYSAFPTILPQSLFSALNTLQKLKENPIPHRSAPLLNIQNRLRKIPKLVTPSVLD